jgi:hypothetical protein
MSFDLKAVKRTNKKAKDVKLFISLYVFNTNMHILSKGIMRRIIFMLLISLCSIQLASAQAQIKFDKLTHDFGTFSESNSVQKCSFTFTNVGDKPLIINQAVASCGCTVPQYTKAPIRPGQKGQITVTYNGKGKFPGHFKKTVTIRTNGVPEMTRIYIEGVMKEDTPAKGK